MLSKIWKRIDKALQRNIKCYKLWRISEAIGIVPYQWQCDFALNKTDSFGDAGMFRRTGKTTAVMLRILMRSNMFVEPYMFADDPDWLEHDRCRTQWFYGEYRRLCAKCVNAGISAPVIPMRRL